VDLNTYEAIVVGSGATGGMVALTLAHQGIKVLVVEAGPILKREEVTNNEPQATFQRISKIISKKIKHQSQHPGYWKNNPNLYANEIKYPYTYPEKKPFLWTQGKQYGGRSLTWGGITLRLSQQDFEAASRDGFGMNWPISYEDLSSYYDSVENLIGIYGSKDNLEQVPNGKYIGNLSLTDSELSFAYKIKKALNHPFIQSRGFDKNCSVKEKEWPKSSSIGSTLQKAIKTGNVQILPNHLVESFETNKYKELATKIKIVNTKNGQKRELSCDLIFLCASTISTLRILLNSEREVKSSGFLDPSKKLGKYLMDHVSLCNFFSMPNESNKIIEQKSLSGAGSFFIPFGTSLPSNPKVDFIRGYGIWGAIDRLGLPRLMQKNTKNSIGFLISHGEVLPMENNKVKLSSITDEWGIPIPHIEFNWGENEYKMISHMRLTMEKLISAADGEKINLKNALKIPFLNFIEKNSIALSGEIPPPGYYIHEVGGAPMGSNEDESVTDKWNRLWRCRNVFVVDGACWTTSSWQSPTLTMMALARRASFNVKKLLSD